MKFTTYDFDLSRFNVDDADDYSYVKLPYESSGNVKVLFVLDHLPSEDLHSGKLLSGVTGDLLGALIAHTKKTYAKQSASFSWLAVSYNAFRTYGKSAEFRAQATEAFTERVNALVCKYEPTYVVAFGTSVMRAFLHDKIVQDGRGRTRYSYWLGVPVPRTISSGKKAHNTTVLSTISLNDIVSGDSGEACLLGYMCRNLAPLFGKTYHVDSSQILSKGAVVIDTIGKFNKLMDLLAEQDYIAVDTETKNLNKITNRLLTIQFAYNQHRGYLVPIAHKDSPFTPSEIGEIHVRLKDYFEGNNRNKYHIYVNAKFDLTQLRAACGVRYFANDVWDCLGADFASDENLGKLDLVLGEYYYSLGNLAVQYGYEGYLTADFGKQNRADFSSADLTSPAVIKYCCLDVCLPYAIHAVQKQYAIDTGYTHHTTVVTKEISDTIHSFSKMEHTGAGLDVNYLFFLRTENSPIELEIRKMANLLVGTPAAKKANNLLANKQGVPTTSMFEDLAPTVLLKLNKPEHKHIFFFETLGLKPLAVGKAGFGKVDKAFQTAYAHVPEVAQYTALEKAKKLKNAFVSSFIHLLGESEDLQKDHRIRPDFGYLTVVTHRTSARNPNLQQVPAHSALAKHIKRLFIARPGTLYVKVDYRVHEVRGWGLIAFDNAVAAVFAAAKELRDAYRLNPTPELAKRLKTEADVHIQNVMIFFVKTLSQIATMDPSALKALRNAVKGIIFGFIYGMGLRAMAANIKQDENFTKNLLATFSKRFPSAVRWSKEIKAFARANLFVEAPTRIRRHLWGYLLPKSIEHADKVAAQNDRQAGNAPIQGMCSKFMMNGIRILDRLIFTEVKKSETFQLFISNSVHDSLENEAGYANLLKSIALIEWSLTEGVKQTVAKRHGFKFVSDLEIDFELGATLSHCQAWDMSVAQLERLVMDSLLFQRNKLSYKLDVARAHSLVFSERAVAEDAPGWMRKQIETLGYKFTLTEKDYIRELLAEGKADIAAGEALLAKASGDKDTVKAANGKVAAGNDLVAYARELNTFRQKYATTSN